MDKNQFLGLLLIGLILIGYSLYIQSKQQQYQQYAQNNDTITQTIDTNNNQNNYIRQTNIDTLADSLKMNKLYEEYGIFGKSALGKEKFITLKNDLIELKISTKGARVYSVNLLQFKTYDKKPLILFDGDDNVFGLKFFANNRKINTQDFYFTATSADTFFDASQQEQTVRLRLYGDENKYVEYVYTLKPNSYLVSLQINFVNLDQNIDKKTTFLELEWKQYIKSLEKSPEQENRYTTIFYKYYQDEVNSFNAMKSFKEEKSIPTKIRWIAYKQQFFSSFLIAENYFDEAVFYMQNFENYDSTRLLKLMRSNIIVPFKHSKNVNIPLQFYFGPNKYSILKKIKINGEKMQMEKVIPLGGALLAWINKFMIIPMFTFLEKYIHNYGIIILIMTLIIKLILFPFTYRSYVSMAKMRVLKPEIDKIIEKIPESKQLERQQKMMELYRKAGVSPFGGCLPMLFQLPILIAMYRFFPASIELRQKSFLWADDLSTYDAFITWNFNLPLLGDHLSLFTLLMAITLIINSMLTNSTMNDTNQQAKMFRAIFMYFFPIMMIVWFNNYSAGLSYYFFLSTLIGILQTLLIRKFIDEDKILAQLRTNIKSNKKVKKSKWQQRLEQMAREQQQMQKKRKK